MLEEIKKLARACSHQIAITLSDHDVSKLVMEIQSSAVNAELEIIPEEEKVNVHIVNHHQNHTLTFKRIK